MSLIHNYLFYHLELIFLFSWVVKFLYFLCIESKKDLLQSKILLQWPLGGARSHCSFFFRRLFLNRWEKGRLFSWEKHAIHKYTLSWLAETNLRREMANNLWILTYSLHQSKWRILDDVIKLVIISAITIFMTRFFSRHQEFSQDEILGLSCHTMWR